MISEKAKNNYYDGSEYKENNADLYIVELEDHIEKLESDNTEMLECLIEYAYNIENYSSIKASKISSNYTKIVSVIEKHKGKPIEEVLKDDK